MKISHNDDIVWTPMKTLNNDLAENIPTRSAYNSILAEKSQQIHIVFYQLSRAFPQVGQICSRLLQHLLN